MMKVFRFLIFLFIFVEPLSVLAQQAPKPINDLEPTVILVSIDGFRAGYLKELPVPELTRLAQQGMHAPLISVFPSVTFVNHYSIATGLYPEHHGILLNEFYAFDLHQFFTHQGHAPTAMDPRWWKGEPIWVTAEKQGQESASAFWPGTRAVIQGVKLSYFKSFTEDGDPKVRVQQVLNWLDLPKAKRPTLLMLYFENVDNAGHQAGPDSEVVRHAAKAVDAAIGLLMSGLKERGIDHQVNLIIVSDHGMEKVDPNKIINIRSYLQPQDLWTFTDHGAVVAVYPKPGKLEAVYQALKKAPVPMQVLRATDIPARLHYAYPKRTPPILCVAENQAFIIGENGHIDKGSHGYDSQLDNMRGIFIAFGPAFKKQYSRSAFENVNIYSLIAHILKLNPVATDGSLAVVGDILY